MAGWQFRSLEKTFLDSNGMSKLGDDFIEFLKLVRSRSEMTLYFKHLEF